MKLSLLEISKNYSLNPETLERWIRQGKIPVTKQGNRGIFNQAELNKWAEKHRTSSTKSQEIDNEKEFSSLLLSAIKKGGVFHGVQGNEKNQVIRSAVELIPIFPGKDTDEVFNQLIAREKLTSTGIGQGVAIPHPRSPLKDVLDEPMIVTCFLENSIDFQSIDDMPVSVIFLLLSPSIEHHLSLLSKLSFCLRDRSFISFIKQQPDSDAFISRVEEIEKSIESKAI